VIAWFNNQIPYNTIPFFGDVVLAVFLPRLLMVIYIATNLGPNNAWFWAHLIGFILALGYNTGRAMQVVKQGKNPWDPSNYMPEK
jgi:hypothetical protein